MRRLLRRTANDGRGSAVPRRSDITADAKTVLIIDDEPVLRDAVRMLLRVEGFEVTGECGNGAEGVRLAATLKPDFVVVDNRMPQMDGPTAAKLIREHAPEVRIVAFSGLVEETPSWADAHLRKDAISEIGNVLRRLAE